MHGRGVERSAGRSGRPRGGSRCGPGIRRPPHGAEGRRRRHRRRAGAGTGGGGRVRGQPRDRWWRDRPISTPRWARSSTSPEPRSEPPRRTEMITDEAAMNQREPKTTHIVISDREPGPAVLQGTDGLPGHGHRAVAVSAPIRSPRRSRIGSASAGSASLTSDELSEVALDVHRRDRRRTLREELRPVARGRAARRARS